jgi:hypothetical protein
VGAHRQLPAHGARLLSTVRDSRRPAASSRRAPTLAAAGVLAAIVALAFTAGLAEAPAHVALSADVTAAPQTGTPWSAPATVNPCPAAVAAQVVFPSDRPNHGTGAGAIVWSDSAHCPGGAGARVAALDASDEALPPATPRTSAGRAIAPQGALVASGAPHGQILIAGSAPGSPRHALAIQGAASGPFAALEPSGGASPPIALTTGYLGDVALAGPHTDALGPTSAGARRGGESGALGVHVERFFAHDFVRDVSGRTASTAPVQALTLAMDFRSEVLAVWQQGAAIYARLVPNRGAPRALQQLAPAGAHVHIAAVLSDDERGIVAWSEQRGEETSVYVDRSATGVRFGAPQLLERVRDPDGLPAPAASPSLVRLSSESVMLAWAGASGGRWVVRAAPVDLNGVGDTSTIAAPAGTDALLVHLAAGPENDAIVLWTEPLPAAAGPPDMARQAIFAARGSGAYRTPGFFGTPQQVAPPTPISDPTVAIDPNSDRAVAVWQGEADAIEYSIMASPAAP